MKKKEDKISEKELDDLFRKITAKSVDVAAGYSYIAKDGTKKGRIYKGGKVITLKR